ncbi:MAG: hypothetical protein IJ272_00690 [Clostridia bacterium]|nr:hypothetical protein [Clostridia bacterium]
MKTKRGIALVALAISIVVMLLIAGIAIVQINNVIFETEKEQFIVELSTIKEKIKERYLLAGSLPVKVSVEYTADELKAQLTDTSHQALLESEITANKDTNNTFLVVDLEKMEIDTDQRGKSQQDIDVFIVASNTLNVYYLKGVEIEGIMRFSLATLVSQDEIEGDTEQQGTAVSLDNDLAITKNTNVWTNEICITVKNALQTGEALQYFIGIAEAKAVENNTIVVNSDNMTEAEKTSFATNKYVTINRLLNGSITETKEVVIDNLDITPPTLGTMEMTDTSNESYNIIKINSTDEGGSGIKCLYYDYVTMLVSGDSTSYYSDRSEVNVNELLGFGKITNDGTITLDKNIKSFIAVVVDNAGNTSDITTFIIEDTYLITK